MSLPKPWQAAPQIQILSLPLSTATLTPQQLSTWGDVIQPSSSGSNEDEESDDSLSPLDPEEVAAADTITSCTPTKAALKRKPETVHSSSAVTKRSKGKKEEKAKRKKETKSEPKSHRKAKKGTGKLTVKFPFTHALQTVAGGQSTSVPTVPCVPAARSSSPDNDIDKSGDISLNTTPGSSAESP